MIKGKTKSGIKFQIDERIKDDARFILFLTKINNDKIEIMERGSAVIGLLKLVFGSEEGVLQFMNAVAEKHEGVCDVRTMWSEMQDIIEAMNAKNSSSSQI